MIPFALTSGKFRTRILFANDAAVKSIGNKLAIELLISFDCGNSFVESTIDSCKVAAEISSVDGVASATIVA
jgi:hypothetical protein